MRESREASIRLSRPEDAKLIPRARTELGILKNLMHLGGLQYLTRTIPLLGGEISVTSIFGQDIINIRTSSTSTVETTETVSVSGEAQGIAVAGTIHDSSPYPGFYWRPAHTPVTLPLPDWAVSSVTVNAISKDGSSVVGALSINALRWSNAGTVVHDLGTGGDGKRATAYDVSDTGAAVAGIITDLTTAYSTAFRWTSLGLAALQTLAPESNPHGVYVNTRSVSITGDGQVVYGVHGPHALGEVNDPAAMLAEYSVWSGLDLSGHELVQFGYDAYIIRRGDISATINGTLYTFAPPADAFVTSPGSLPVGQIRVGLSGLDEALCWFISTGIIDIDTGLETFVMWGARRVISTGLAVHADSFPSTPTPISDFVCWWDSAGAVHKTTVKTLNPTIFVSKDASALIYKTLEYTGGSWRLRRDSTDSTFGDSTFSPVAIDGSGANVIGYSDTLNAVHWSATLGLLPLLGPEGAIADSTKVTAISQDGTIIVGNYYTEEDAASRRPCMWATGGFSIDPETDLPVTVPAVSMASNWGDAAIPAAVTNLKPAP